MSVQSSSFRVRKSMLFRGIWRILLRSGRPIPWMVTSAVVAAFTERSPRESVQKPSAELGILHLTMFDLVMKSFWQVFVIELGDTDMRLCHKACALLLEWFLVALSHAKVLISDECAVCMLKCFLGLNRILVTHFRCKTTHHKWW